MAADAEGLRLSRVRGRRVLGADGTRLGRVVDLAFRSDERHPSVSQVVFAEGTGGPRRVAWAAISSIDDDGLQLSPGALVDDGLPAPTTPLACRDILDAQIVDVAGKRVRRVSDVWLSRTRENCGSPASTRAGGPSSVGSGWAGAGPASGPRRSTGPTSI